MFSHLRLPTSHDPLLARSRFEHAYININIYIYIYLYVYMYTYIYAYVYIYMHACISVFPW